MRIAILGFLAGIFALQQQAYLPHHQWWLLVLLPLFCLGLLRCLLYFYKHNDGMRWVQLVRQLLIGILFILLGVIWASWRAELRLADVLPRAWEGRDIDITGTIASLPQQTELGTRFELDTEQIHTPDAQVPRHISLTWYKEVNKEVNKEINKKTAKKASKEANRTNHTIKQKQSALDNPNKQEHRPNQEIILPPELKPGEQWQLTVRLRRPHGSLNPHGFDYEAWALEQNIRATGYIRSKGINERRQSFVEGFHYRLDRLRLIIRERLHRILQGHPMEGVLIGLTIGEQNAIPTEQWKVFWRTGVGHLMSISGLHITMVASLFYWLGFQIWVRFPILVSRIPAQRIAVIAGLIPALAYSLIAGFSVPTQRTLFMLAMVAVSLWVKQSISASRALCWAILGVLLLDPWAVLAPGFWLSFGAVAAIFYVTANRVGKMSAVKAALLTQVAVTLGLLPMTLALFQEVSVISPIANAMAIPLISMVIVPLTLLGAILPIDSLLLLASWLMQWCFEILTWLSLLPSAVWQSHAPPLWALILALAGVAWLLAPRGLPMRKLGLVAMLPLFLVLPPVPKPGELWVTVLDVGQGLAAVIRTSQHTLVYDTGPGFNPDSDSGNRVVVPYLRGEGLRVLDGLLISHNDEDHSGGARSVIDARNPKWVLTSMSAQSDSLLTANEVIACEAGDGWRWDGIDFDILHPLYGIDDNTKTNEKSCVLKITAPGGSILLPGDIEKASEAALVTRAAEDLKSDVLVAPHHGSKTSSTEAFLTAVSPHHVIISAGYRNRFRHPHADVLARYYQHNMSVSRTDEAGALTLKFPATAGNQLIVEGFRAQRQRYWLDSMESAKGSIKESGEILSQGGEE